MEHVEHESKLADEGSKKLAKEMVGEVFDAIQATFESGKIDAGATLNLGDKSMALVVGAYVADPESLEDALKKFAKLAEKEPNFPGIKFDADEAWRRPLPHHQLPVPATKRSRRSRRRSWTWPWASAPRASTWPWAPTA